MDGDDVAAAGMKGGFGDGGKDKTRSQLLVNSRELQLCPEEAAQMTFATVVGVDVGRNGVAGGVGNGLRG